MLNKRGEKSGNGLIWLVVIVGAIFFLSGGQQAQQPTTETPTTGVGQTTTTVLCPDTAKKAYFKVFDADAATATLVTGTIQIYDDTGKLVSSDTLSGSAWSSGASICTQGKQYEAVLFTSAGTTASARGTFQVGFSDTYTTMYTNSLDNLQVRVKYVDTDAYAFLGAHNTFATNSTAYTDLNTTLVSTDAADTAKAIGADGKLEVKISAKAETARKYHGDKKLKEFLCVDLGTANVWQEPVMSKGGAILTNVKGTFNSNDLVYSSVSDSEYCYDAGTVFPNTEQVFDMSVQTRASQNPGASDDPIVYFLPQGLYKSVAPATIDKPTVGMVTDASTQALAGTSTAYVPKLQIQVS